MDALKETVTIQLVESNFISTGAQVFKLKTDKGVFQFFDTKRDGSQTKAAEQFKKFGFKMGDTVEVAYNSVESTTINQHTGKPFVNNTILYFSTQDEHTPVKPKEDIPVIREDFQPGDKGDGETFLKIQNLFKRVAKLEEVAGITDDEIKLEDLPF